MIQRKQTLYLLAALIVQLVCLCLPVARLVPDGMGIASEVYNLWINTDEGARYFTPWPLFAILLTTCPVAIGAIALYHNRILQAKVCLINMLLLLGWYAVYAYLATSLPGEQEHFRVSFAAALPFVAMVFTFLARRGVIADEKLVRSMDRIR